MIIDGMSSPNMMQVELAVNSKEECEKQFSVAYNDEYQLCTVPSSTKGTCQVIRFLALSSKWNKIWSICGITFLLALNKIICGRRAWSTY